MPLCAPKTPACPCNQTEPLPHRHHHQCGKCRYSSSSIITKIVSKNTTFFCCLASASSFCFCFISSTLKGMARPLQMKIIQNICLTDFSCHLFLSFSPSLSTFVPKTACIRDERVVGAAWFHSQHRRRNIFNSNLNNYYPRYAGRCHLFAF